ncbi:hypothetical protein RI367_006230 [Sorochytrium milnesiophthora]
MSFRTSTTVAGRGATLALQRQSQSLIGCLDYKIDIDLARRAHGRVALASADYASLQSIQDQYKSSSSQSLEKLSKMRRTAKLTKAAASLGRHRELWLTYHDKLNSSEYARLSDELQQLMENMCLSDDVDVDDAEMLCECLETFRHSAFDVSTLLDEYTETVSHAQSLRAKCQSSSKQERSQVRTMWERFYRPLEEQLRQHLEQARVMADKVAAAVDSSLPSRIQLDDIRHQDWRLNVYADSIAARYQLADSPLDAQAVQQLAQLDQHFDLALEQLRASSQVDVSACDNELQLVFAKTADEYLTLAQKRIPLCTERLSMLYPHLSASDIKLRLKAVDTATALKRRRAALVGAYARQKSQLVQLLCEHLETTARSQLDRANRLEEQERQLMNAQHRAGLLKQWRELKVEQLATIEAEKRAQEERDAARKEEEQERMERQRAETQRRIDEHKAHQTRVQQEEQKKLLELQGVLQAKRREEHKINMERVHKRHQDVAVRKAAEQIEKQEARRAALEESELRLNAIRDMVRSKIAVQRYRSPLPSSRTVLIIVLFRDPARLLRHTAASDPQKAEGDLQDARIFAISGYTDETVMRDQRARFLNLLGGRGELSCESRAYALQIYQHLKPAKPQHQDWKSQVVLGE